MRLEGRVAIVTGAGRNVGRAVSEVLAREGAVVAVVDLDRNRAEGTVAAVEAGGGEARLFLCDVSDPEAVARMVDEVAAWHERIDVLVNGVAITDRGRTILDLAVDEWTRVLDVSLRSAFVCTQAVARRMVEDGTAGAIVNIGSTSAHAGRRNVVAYPVAKAGVVALTRTTAAQLGLHGIRVNTVTPNKVGSPVGEDVEPPDRKRDNMLGSGAAPIDIAEAVLYMVSDAARFITAAELLVDGGALYGGSVG
jgi:NAD(P)-dependent dehydrogenase (short-subunit alcohol dehydrogenase family)